MSNTEFSTEDLDLAAAILAATGKRPQVSRQPDRQLAVFTFPRDEAVQAVVMAYASGQLTQNVKLFAAARCAIYRAVRECKGGGR